MNLMYFLDISYVPGANCNFSGTSGTSSVNMLGDLALEFKKYLEAMEERASHGRCTDKEKIYSLTSMPTYL